MLYREYFEKKLEGYRKKGLEERIAFRNALKPTARLFLSHFYHAYMVTMERYGAKLKWKRAYPVEVLGHTEVPPPHI